MSYKKCIHLYYKLDHFNVIALTYKIKQLQIQFVINSVVFLLIQIIITSQGK